MANEERGRGPKVYIPVTLDHYRTGNYQPETIAKKWLNARLQAQEGRGWSR